MDLNIFAAHLRRRACIRISPRHGSLLLTLLMLLNGCALVPEYKTPVSEKHVEQKEELKKDLKEQQKMTPQQPP